MRRGFLSTKVLEAIEKDVRLDLREVKKLFFISSDINRKEKAVFDFFWGKMFAT